MFVILHKLTLKIVKVHVPAPGIPVGLSGLSILLLQVHVGLGSEAPDLHVVDVEGGGGGELDSVEGVHLAAGRPLAQIVVEHQPKLSCDFR